MKNTPLPIPELLQQAQQTELSQMVPQLLDFDIDVPDFVRQCAKDRCQFVVLICFAHGCFHSLEFILGLMCSSLLQLAIAMLVVIPQDFQYPTNETCTSSAQDVESACKSSTT